MIYYKSTTGEIYAYESGQERQEFGAPDLVELTLAEVSDLLNPQPTTEQLAEAVRAVRDQRIESVRWRIERHKDEAALGREPTEPLEPLLQYVQLLRDVPNQEGFPESVQWPLLQGTAHQH